MFTKKLRITLFSTMLGVGTLFAEYAPTTQDYEFAKMLCYKLQDAVSRETQEQKQKVVSILSTFAQKYTEQDPRFSRLMLEVSNQIQGIESTTPKIISTDRYHLEVQSPESEKTTSLRIIDIEAKNREVSLTIVKNANQIHPKSLPYTPNLTTSGIAHCSIRSTTPIKWRDETIALYGVRNKAYSLWLSYQDLHVPSTRNVEESMIATMNIPSKVPAGDYTLMCHVIVLQTDMNNPSDYYGSRPSTYYYFDIEIE